ncbi:hypothetical protein SAMN02745227_00427 [Anaerobranca californiensis DSM 14826]|jgi:DNA-binding transcriptional MerR regulator|uniref:Uncharacterized protein n=1 Tax=Anaerobranca californiensis DSM 14826 TaxID=1120989 RepID=A0A1M6L9M9_9FIRM|nr:hypothetical protein [Anaerobranca californiensis]SHJ67896.1 hypothetical protein SAMN02745227_00427 [Anaerobranca californiensis DSM 14826]
MNKKIVITVLVLSIFVVGLGFVSAQETEEGTRFFNRRNLNLRFGMKEGQCTNLLDDQERLEKIAELKGMTVEELQEFLAEKREKMENGENLQMRRMKGFRGRIGNGQIINRLLEDEELLKEFAEKKGVSVEELKEWLEKAPFLNRN